MTRKKFYRKGANRTSHGGSGSGVVRVGARYDPNLTSYKFYGSNPLGRTWHPKKVAKALGSAKSQMGSEWWRTKQKKDAADRHANDVPKGHKRISRRDPETGEINVIDLPIDGHKFREVMRLIQGRRDVSHLVPDLTPDQLEFLSTGRLKSF